MVETMRAMVRAGHGLPAGGLFIVSGAVGGLVIGGSVATIRWFAIDVPLSPPAVWALAGILALGALRDWGLLRVRIPTRHAQVDDILRRAWPWQLYIPLYGFTLGTGLATYIPFAAFLGLLAAAFSVGGAASVTALLAYGAGRALGPWIVVAASRRPTSSVIEGLTRRRPAVQVVSGLSQVALALGFLATRV